MLAGLMALSAGLAYGASRAGFSYPSLVREARGYDQARDLCLRTKGESGCHYEPAVVLGQWRREGRRTRYWRIRLALADGATQMLQMTRGSLGEDLEPGTRVGALFWRGKVALLVRGRDQAETWASPDWRLTFGRWSIGFCSVVGLLLTVPLVFGTASWLRRFLQSRAVSAPGVRCRRSR
jgi:hypothetical protein